VFNFKCTCVEDKYPNLCANCKNPSKCSVNDQFWGRQGALQCLSDCFGDVSWARLSDVRVHFKVNKIYYSCFICSFKNYYALNTTCIHLFVLKGDSTNACSKISFLCPNGTLQPMETSNPCVWVSRPWPAVIARK